MEGEEEEANDDGDGDSDDDEEEEEVQEALVVGLEALRPKSEGHEMKS